MVEVILLCLAISVILNLIYMLKYHIKKNYNKRNDCITGLIGSLTFFILYCHAYCNNLINVNKHYYKYSCENFKNSTIKIIRTKCYERGMSFLDYCVNDEMIIIKINDESFKYLKDSKFNIDNKINATVKKEVK